MKVARHECLERVRREARPVGYGMIGRRVSNCRRQWKILATRIIPFPTGRVPFGTFPRHFMPGYLHFVPTGEGEGRFFERSAIRLAVSSWLNKRNLLIENGLRTSDLAGPGIDTPDSGIKAPRR